MNENALAASDLSVRYERRIVLHGLRLSIRFGEVTAVLGPNGAGKSTLLKALAGLVPFTGSVRVAGVDQRALGRLDRARRVAYVPQRSELSVPLRVRAVIEQGRYPFLPEFGKPRESDREAIDSALDAAGVRHLEHRSYTALSGGEQRRVLLARALATSAPILLLDEPTASLDIEQCLHVHALLRRLAREGRAVVSVMHGLGDARAQADRAVLLAAGRLVASGTPKEVVAAELVRNIYGVDLVEGGAIGFRMTEEAG